VSDCQHYETEWEDLRLVIEERPEHWQVIIYDPEQCEVLYAAERITLESAKIAAVEFVAVTRFGPQHDLKPDVVAAMLVWELV
jgi:hypothetical protein